MKKIIRFGFSVLVLISLLLSASPALAKKNTARKASLRKAKIVKSNLLHNLNWPVNDLSKYKTVKLSGELVNLVDREDGESESFYLSYKRKNKNIMLRLYFAEDFDRALIGTQVQVKLLKRAKKALVLSIMEKKFLGLFSFRAAISNDGVSGEDKFLIVRVKGPNQESEMTLEQLEQIMFSETVFEYRGKSVASVKSYFDYHSAGAYKVVGDIRQQDIILDYDTTCANTRADNITNLESELRAQGVKLSDYDRFIYVYPSMPCSWNGFAFIGGTFSVINGRALPRTYSHEIGHNLRMHHAGTSLIQSHAEISREYEYGDLSDVMGSPGNTLNAIHREQMHWSLGENSVLEVDSSGEYQIGSLDHESNTAIKVIKIKNPHSDDFTYLSFRTTEPVSYDYGNNNSGTYSQKVSMHSGTGKRNDKTTLKAVLGEGETIVDPETGYKFTVIAINDTSALVSFEKSELSNYDLVLSFHGLSDDEIDVGDYVTSSFTISNTIDPNSSNAGAATDILFSFYANPNVFEYIDNNARQTCYRSGSHVECILEDLAPGESIDLGLRLRAKDYEQFQISIPLGYANVTAINPNDLEPSNNRVDTPAILRINGIEQGIVDLAVSSSINKVQFQESETIPLKLKLSNLANGEDASVARLSLVSLTIPEDLELKSIPSSCILDNGSDIYGFDPSIICEIQDLLVGEQRNMNFNFELSVDIPSSVSRIFTFEPANIKLIEPSNIGDENLANNYSSTLSFSVIGDDDPIPPPSVLNGSVADMALSLEPVIAIDQDAELSYIKSGENIVVHVVAENKSNLREGKTAYGVSFSSTLSSQLEYIQNPHSDACNIDQGASLVSCNWDYIPAKSKKRETLIFKPKANGTNVYAFGAGSSLETLNNIDRLEVEDPDLGNNTHAELYWLIKD